MVELITGEVLSGTFEVKKGHIFRHLDGGQGAPWLQARADAQPYPHPTRPRRQVWRVPAGIYRA